MKKKSIGRREKVSFPDFGIKNIDAKIDTGAYTSSIYCSEIQEIDGVLHCRFLDKGYKAYNKKHYVLDSYIITTIKSSNGITEQRFKITTNMKFGSKIYIVELTLTDRVDMKYPVLLGRKFLRGKFIVDVSKTYKLKKSKK
ncbi:MAG: RimK/LysX family protein [Saprospiraceae bacterium]|nr:RimK/LysX family protein [Saprospiraceae bacterium]